MPENQAPEIPSRILTAPPGLTLSAADAPGLCADGHCALSRAQSGDTRASGADAD